MVVIALAVSMATPAWPVGFAYTEANEDEGLEFTSIEVNVNIQDRMVVTRLDQLITNRSYREVEGIFDFPLPPDAVLTDLVMWIDGQPVKGLILERELAARGYSYISSEGALSVRVDRAIDSGVRVRVFSFPARGSRRIEIEYVQTLEARDGKLHYLLPLVPEAEQPAPIGHLAIEATVAGQHDFQLLVPEEWASAVTIESPAPNQATVSYAVEALAPERDFEMIVVPASGALEPVLLSFMPQHADGYFALWIPPLREILPTSDAYPPTFKIEKLHLTGLETNEVYPSDVTTLSAGQEIFQVGRYRQGGPATLELVGQLPDRSLSFEFPFTFASREQGEETRSATELLNYDFDDGEAGDWRIGPETGGNWTVDEDEGVLRVVDPAYISRLYWAVDDSSYVIETRVRSGGPECKIIFHQADRTESWRLDLHPTGEARLTIGGTLGEWLPIPEREWYAVRIELSDGRIDTYINGSPVHRDVWMGGVVPDGKIGVGSWNAWAEFDYVRVFSNSQRGDEAVRRSPLPRLWAWNKVKALEAQIVRSGPMTELLEQILALGLDYRLVTRMTALFAPEEGIQIEAPLERGQGSLAETITAAQDSSSWTDSEGLPSGNIIDPTSDVLFTDLVPPILSLDFDLAPYDQAERAITHAIPGERYALQLNLHNAPPIKGWSATLKYDSQQLRYVGDSFQATEFIPGLTTLVDDKEGQVSIGGSALGSEDIRVGSGSLAILAFEVLDGFTGRAHLSLKEWLLQLAEGEVMAPSLGTTAHILGASNPLISLDFDLRERDQKQWIHFDGAPGQIHSLQLHIANAPRINGWSTTIHYNPEHLRYLSDSFEPGLFLPGFVALVDVRDSTVTVGGAVLGSDAGKSNKGTLGTLSFEVLDGFTDRTRLTITSMKIRHTDGDVRTEPTHYEAILVSSPGQYFSTEIEIEEDQAPMPRSTRLQANFPNPFNSFTTLRYQLDQDAWTRLDLFDLNGQKIRTLVHSFQESGEYALQWDGTNQQGQKVATGVYLVRLQTDNRTETRKMLLAK